MKTAFLSIGTFLAMITSNPVNACGPSPLTYALSAISTNEAMASQAVAALRSMGPAGLNALLQSHAPLLAAQDERDDRWRRLRTALDSVAKQRDAHASRLYWHTDFDQAKAEAGRTRRPILSLRLLGNLDEDLSCANSRFFRTTLYSNKEVSDYLRTHFVLHWKSVRPAPRLTIDMGDGRTLERTITGNSIHYVLDQNGDVIDAIPGLYGAPAFLAGLKKAEQAALAAENLQGAERKTFLQGYHITALDGINQRWANDVLVSGAALVRTNAMARQERHPAAVAAMPLAVSKSMVERPLLRALVPRRDALERSMDEELWTRMAALHTNEVVLDANSIALIRAQRPFGDRTERMEQHILGLEGRMKPLLAELKQSIAMDTVRNEYIFHSKIHEWLAGPDAAMTVDALNSRVYDELFLTPESDPWLGLAPLNTFSGLANGGLIETSKIQAPNSK